MISSKKEWMESDSPSELLECLEKHGDPDDYQLRLFALACWSWLGKGYSWNPDGCQHFARVVREYAENKRSRSEVDQALRDLRNSDRLGLEGQKRGELAMASAISTDPAIEAARKASSEASSVMGDDAAKSARGNLSAHLAQIERAYEDAYDEEAANQVQWLRRMFPCPFA